MDTTFGYVTPATKHTNPVAGTDAIRYQVVDETAYKNKVTASEEPIAR